MINAIGDVMPNGVGQLACDDATDLTDLPEYAQNNNLKCGSSCICIDTGQVFMMKSDFNWKEI